MRQNLDHPPPCPLCGADRFHQWKLGLVQCQSCSLVLSPAIWQPQANELLEEEWFGDGHQPRKSFWVALFERWNNRKTLARLALARPKGRRLLEIGVGSGSFLNAAHKHGYAVMGCDLSETICKRVRHLYGFDMHCGPLTTLPATSRFDVIVMNHVLEHVQQPVEFLKQVSHLLAPAGVAHIAVPNLACWQSHLRGWTSYEPYHLSYFAPHTLTRAVLAGTLAVDKVTTHDSFSGWFLAVLRTVLGVNRTAGAVIRPAAAAAGHASVRRPNMAEHIYRLVMVFVGVCLWPLRALQAKLGRGDEVVCMALKPKAVSAEKAILLQ